MSKKKKSLDEMLEDGLVPEDEQPYEIPENWVWTTLEFIGEWGSGGTPSRKHSEYYNGHIPWIKTGELNDCLISDTEEKITELGLKKSSAKLFSKGSVVLAMYGATIGKLGILDIDATTNQACAVVNPNKITTSQFLYYYLLANRREIISLGKGGAQPNISQAIIKAFPFVIPPLEEQKRIISKIEILFIKLDEAKQLIEEVKESFELRRAAILTKAFEMYEPTSYKTIEEVCTIKNGYAFKSKDFVDEGIQVVRMGNLYQNQLDLSRSPVYLPPDYNEKLLDKYMIKNGDILLTLTGTKYKRDYGYAVKIEHLDVDLLLNQRIMSLTPNTEDEYLFYFLQTPEFRNDFFSFETGGVNQGNVGSKSVATIKIPWIEDISKRKEIVNSIQKQLDVEKFVSEILNNQIDIDNLKHSILSKAFKGELGTNDSTDEPAIELLKSILQEKL